MGSKSVYSLTGIRGAAALWVVMHHMYRYVAILLAVPWLLRSSFLANGYRGVDLFFILSGFILMRTHGSDFATMTWPATRRFFLSRFVRVYPVNAAVLLGILVIIMLVPGYISYDRSYYIGSASYRSHNLSLASFVQSILLLQNWTVVKLGDWNVPAWSLSAEIPGYIVFPVLAFYALKQTSVRLCWLWACASLAILTLISFAVHHAYTNSTGSFGLVRMAFCFTSGLLLQRAVDLLGERGRHWASLVSVASVLFVAVSFVVPKLSILDAFAFAALIASLSYKTGPIDGFLQSRVMLWLGKISFSLYLTQFFLENVFLYALYDRLRHQSVSVNALALFLLSGLFLAVAFLCFRLVEKPMHRLAHRLAGQPSGRASIERPAQASVSSVPFSGG